MSTQRIAAFLLKNMGRASDRDLRAVPDRELLRRFAAEQDERAFTELVQRHGALVWRVCRGIVANEQDAEDVFQATFLVLARKVASPKWSDSVAHWLYETAYRLAHNHTKVARRRREARLEQLERRQAEADSADEMSMREARAVLYEELAALPEELQTPLVLCFLEGATQEQAAQRLGWSYGTLRRRLDEGKERLGKRLTRRGMGLPLLLLTGVLTQSALGAGMPPGLAAVTVKAALAFAASGSAGVGVSAGAVALADGALRSVFFSKGAVLAVVLTVAAAAAGGGLVLRGGKALETPPQEGTESASPSRTAMAPRERVDLHGDPLPPGALARLGTVRGRLGHFLNSLAFTRDGKRLLTAGGSHLPRLWNFATRRLLREFDQIPKPESTDDDDFPVYSTVLSPDNRILAVRSGRTGNLYLLDATTGRRLREFACAKRVMSAMYGVGGPSCTFSPDSKAIAAQIDDRIELRDVATGRMLWQANETEILLLACSPDGRLLASVGAEGWLRLWDAHNGEFLRELEREERITEIAFSPDGRTLAVCGRKEKKWSVHLWDVAAGKQMSSLVESVNPLSFLSFSPDGKIAAISDAGGIALWETATGKVLRRCPNSHFIGGPGAFSPDGELLAAKHGSIVRFWETATGQECASPLSTGHEQGVFSVAFTPDGQTLISEGGDQMVRWWDTRTGRQLLCLTGMDYPIQNYGLPQAVLSPDATTLAATFVGAPDGPIGDEDNLVRTGICLREVATGKELSRLEGGHERPAKLVFSPDGKLLAQSFMIPSGQPQVSHLWDTSTGKRLEYELRGTCPMFSPDGSMLALLEHEKAIHFWQTATGAKVHSLLLSEDIWHMTLSPDGQMLAAATRKGTIGLFPWSWDKQSGGRLGRPLWIVPPSQVSAPLAFSPDGRMLASSGKLPGDSTVYVWETASGKERARFAEHHGRVFTLTFSPDGRRLASGSLDTTILIWDIAGRAGNGALRTAKHTNREWEVLWTDLASTDAERAGQAVWALAAAGPQVVSWLDARLRAGVAEADNPQELLFPQEERQPPSAEVLRGVRAVEVLEYMGTSEAHRVLVGLSRGVPDSLLTREAQSAVNRFQSPARLKRGLSISDASTQRR